MKTKTCWNIKKIVISFDCLGIRQHQKFQNRNRGIAFKKSKKDKNNEIYEMNYEAIKIGENRLS